MLRSVTTCYVSCAQLFFANAPSRHWLLVKCLDNSFTSIMNRITWHDFNISPFSHTVKTEGFTLGTYSVLILARLLVFLQLLLLPFSLKMCADTQARTLSLSLSLSLSACTHVQPYTHTQLPMHDLFPFFLPLYTVLPQRNTHRITLFYHRQTHTELHRPTTDKHTQNYTNSHSALQFS
jgi:hypothetical protein